MKLDTIAQTWTTALLEWYLKTFMIITSPELLISQIELLIMVYIVIQFLKFLFPVFKKIFSAIFFPFRFLHIWFHLEASRRIKKEKNDLASDSMILYLFSNFDFENRASLGIEISTKTVDVYHIAMAPTKGAVLLIVVSFILSPIFLLTGTIGLFFHMYILIGSLTVLWTDLNDYILVYQVALLNADLHPKYIVWIGVIFPIVLSGVFIMTQDLLQAVLSGIGLIILYLLLLLWIISRVTSQTGQENIVDKNRSFPQIKL